MKITYDNTDIPDWIKPHIRTFCDCGGVMVDDGPIDSFGVMKLTQRWCSNPKCPYHMGEKIQLLAKYFGVVGVGEQTALDMAKGLHLQNHLQALAYWFPSRPEIHLYEVGILSYIYGIDSGWKELLAGFTSFEEFFASDKYIPEVVWSHREYLLQCEKYFRVKQERIRQEVLHIWLTGSMRGFNSRKDFLEYINDKYKDYFRIEDNKKTLRNTYCLVKEDNSIDYEKTNLAVINDIPIMSSAKFLKLLERMKEELDNENAGVCGEVLQ